MLPVTHRLRRRADFRRAVRVGQRASTPTMVAHRLLEPAADRCRVGFVVSRSVGTAVARNKVKRRLRMLMLARLAQLAPGLLVLRATPRAAKASYAALGADVDSCLLRLEHGGR